MPQEILNSSTINEVNDSMDFEVELFKSKRKFPISEKKYSNNFEGILKSFFRLNLSKQKRIILMKDKHDKNKFEEERLKFWEEITQMPYKDFHRLDRFSKYKLAKIIPGELSKKRFQDLVIPKDLAPNSLKRVFQYVAFIVKSDLIAECTSNETSNYRPLTFPPEFIIRKGLDGAIVKKHSVESNDWHAASLMVFQNLANLFYGISLEFCNPATCPIMKIGKDFEYMWCDGITFVKPISIPARTYMKFCLLWTQKQLKDPDLITSTPESTYPPDILNTWKMLYRRLLRVFSHLIINHSGDFEKIGVLELVLQCTLRRFILYGLETGLTSRKELEPIKIILKKVQKEFKLNGSFQK